MADGDNMPTTSPSAGSGSITDLVVALQNGVRYIGQVVLAIQTVFPQQTGTSATATGGAGTLPAAPDGFIVVNVPGVGVRKVPYYKE